ncbi:MAG: NUDIX domain-containing protein [Desulfovibrio sp.]
MKAKHQDTPSLSAEEPILEVMDDSNRPLMYVPESFIHTQKLQHRCVALLIYNKKQELIIAKRSAYARPYPSRLDLPVIGHINAGESMYDAAIRLLQKNTGLNSARLAFQEIVPPLDSEDKEHIAIYTMQAQDELIKPATEDIDEYFFHTEDELRCIHEQFNDFLTPRLQHLLGYEFSF